MTSSYRERLDATLRLTVVAAVSGVLALAARPVGAEVARAQPAARPTNPRPSSRSRVTEAARERLAQRRLLHGVAEYEDGRYASAIDELRAAIDLAAPPLAYFYLGRCYEKLDDRSVAVAEYASFVANAPKSMRPLRDVAVQRLVAWLPPRRSRRSSSPALPLRVRAPG